MTYNIAVCDDNADDVKYIFSLVKAWADLSGNAVNIKMFPSAEAFLFHYAEDKAYDILLLDIEMGGMDGVKLAKTVRGENNGVQIIFVTGFPDFISEGYEVGAVHYLMKPVSGVKLSEVLERAVKNLGKTERTVLFTVGGESIRVPVGDVIYAEAFAHNTAVTTVKGMITVAESISEVEKLLGEGFIRCHRSYVVNLKYISKITRTDVILDGGKALPLSRRLYDEVNRVFIAYYRGR